MLFIIFVFCELFRFALYENFKLTVYKLAITPIKPKTHITTKLSIEITTKFGDLAISDYKQHPR